MALPGPLGGLVTSTADIATPTGYTNDTPLTAAIQTIWSKEILFQAMPVLRFEQFSVKKTELGVQPGLTVNFMRYNNLAVAQDRGATLTEGVRMEPDALSASQIQLTVQEHGKAVAVTELLLHAAFDDVMASASRLLGRHMAQSMDVEARNILYGTGTTFGGTAGVAPDVVFGRYPLASRDGIAPYNPGTLGTSASPGYMSPASVKDAVAILAARNIPRLGDTYVCFVHPAQSRALRDWPEFIEVTKYAAPGNFMLGEIGRYQDVVFIETTQVLQGQTTTNKVVDVNPAVAGYQDPLTTSYTAIMIGDNAFGHAISLPVELRDGGVLDFGREHGLAWYGIWGFGVITHESRVLINSLGGSIQN